MQLPIRTSYKKVMLELLTKSDAKFCILSTVFTGERESFQNGDLSISICSEINLYK